MSQNATSKGFATDGVVVSRKYDITPQVQNMAEENEDTQWAYSKGGERYWDRLDSFDEAVEAGRRNFHGEGDYFYVAKVVEHVLSDVVDIEDMLENATERAFDMLYQEHEWYPWGDVDKEAEQELLDMIDAWATKHGLHPDFYTVTDEVKVLVEPDE